MVWAIGDIQGCYSAWMRLLEKIDFNPSQDRLWLTGDLVSRGKESLEVLRFCFEHQAVIDAVLGNHDMALIGAHYGVTKPDATLLSLLDAPDADRLIGWLRLRPFLHLDTTMGYVMSHAGISPEFDLGMAIRYARQVESKLHAPNPKEWLKMIFAKKESIRFDRYSSHFEQERYIVSSFTRMRFCHQDYRLDFKQKGPPTPDLEQKGLVPWFACKGRKAIELKIVFGHWSALGFYQDENVVCLDTGCVWKRELTALRLDAKEPLRVSVACV